MQCAAFCAERSSCPSCGRKLRAKARGQVRYRTVFGDVTVASPRFCHCPCQADAAKTFSPLTELLPDHVAPELLWLETKWASLVSFGVTAALLKDALPIDRRLCPDTIRRHLGRVAARMESELADERFSFIETSARQRERLPNPEGPITAGMDGGYIRSREDGQSHFEVTVGKSIPTDRPGRYLGLVQSHDDKPRRRLPEMLKDQGWQENQPVTFMTDGGDTVISLAQYMAPASEHILDWFHITMRITVMQQYLKGLAHHNPGDAGALSRQLRQIKGFLWHGNLHDGQAVIEDLAIDLDAIETDCASIKALRKAASEFETYMESTAKCGQSGDHAGFRGCFHTMSCDAAMTQTCHHRPNSATAPHFAVLPQTVRHRIPRQEAAGRTAPGSRQIDASWEGASLPDVPARNLAPRQSRGRSGTDCLVSARPARTASTRNATSRGRTGTCRRCISRVTGIAAAVFGECHSVACRPRPRHGSRSVPFFMTELTYNKRAVYYCLRHF